MNKQESINPIDLSGLVALVTGGSGGIGQEISRTLARAGATVAIGYNQREDQARRIADSCGSSSFALKANLREPEECRTMVDSVIERCGKLDILVNNAAISEKDSVDTPYEEWLTHWRKCIDANLMSAVNLSYWALRHMKQRRTGRIVNISSRSAFRAETEHIAYAVTKAALVNLTRCLARAHASDGIRVFAVAPGFIEAGMGLKGIAENEDHIRSEIPSGIIGSGQDVANAVLFLSSTLSDYMTGSTLDVNGGSYLH